MILLLTACYYCRKMVSAYPTGIYIFKVNSRKARARFGICLKLTIKTPEQGQGRIYSYL